MTVASTTVRATSDGNGVTTSFSYPYHVIAAADLKVYKDEVLQVLTTDYTLSGTAPYTSGTDVQFVTAPAADESIVIFRDPAVTQTTDYVENDSLPVETVETALDKLTMIAQRTADQVRRSLRLPDADARDPDDMEMAGGAAAWSGKYMYFDEDGLPEPADVLEGTTTLSQSVFDGYFAGTSQTTYDSFLALSPPYKRNAAEISAAVTPSSYAYLAEPFVYAKRYGCSSAASAATNATAINRALAVAAAAGGGIVMLPPGEIQFNSTLNVGTRVQLRGVGGGYGVSSATTLIYTGAAAVGIQVGTVGGITSGFYSHMQDFSLKNNGTGTVGILISSVHVTLHRVTVTAYTTVGWSASAVGTEVAVGAYTVHLLECYLVDNAVGFDCVRGQDFKLINCYIERNGTNVRIGQISTVTGFAMIGGVQQLLGAGYSGDTNELTNSVGVDVVRCRGFLYSGVYSENGSGVVATSAAQRAIVFRACEGGTVNGSFFTGGGQATGGIHMEDDARGIVIEGNDFRGYNGYGITYDSGAQFDIGINCVSIVNGLWNDAWTPVPTSLTVVNGTGGATYSGTWYRRGDTVHFTIRIAITGTATSASAAGTTYFAIGAMMPAVAAVSADCSAVSDDVATVKGVSGVFTNGRIYTPVWAAHNGSVTITGSYKCAAATP